MTEKRKKERKSRSIRFWILAVFWVIGVATVVHRLAVKSNTNTDVALSFLAKYEADWEEQESLIEMMHEYDVEIRRTSFDVYQQYYVDELERKINEIKGTEMTQNASASYKYRVRGAELLKLLLNSREELAALKRTVALNEENIKNCKAGGQIPK